MFNVFNISQFCLSLGSYSHIEKRWMQSFNMHDVVWRALLLFDTNPSLEFWAFLPVLLACFILLQRLIGSQFFKWVRHIEWSWVGTKNMGKGFCFVKMVSVIINAIVSCQFHHYWQKNPLILFTPNFFPFYIYDGASCKKKVIKCKKIDEETKEGQRPWDLFWWISTHTNV